MKDTLAGILILLTLFAGYFVFKSNVNTSSTQAVTVPIKEKVSKLSKKLARKANHERTNNRKSRPLQDDDYHQGSRREAEEVEKLPSIYEDKEGRLTEVNSSESTVKSIYGVPVNAWVLSRQNSLTTETADPHLADGMRVFIGCVEVKKEGSKELTKSDCAKIASKNQNIR